MHDRRVCCARCGQPATGVESAPGRLSAPHAGPSPSPGQVSGAAEAYGAASSAGDGLPDFTELEAWDFEETIRHAQRLMGQVTSARPIEPGSAALPGEVADQRAEGWTPATAPSSAASGSMLPWLILALGIGVFTCGAALVGFSLTTGSALLWRLALPMVLGGQLAVLFVVIWQLEVVWHSNRATFVALHTVDDQLRRLRIDAKHDQASVSGADRLGHRALESAASESPASQVALDSLRAELDALASQLDRSKDAA